MEESAQPGLAGAGWWEEVTPCWDLPHCRALPWINTPDICQVLCHSASPAGGRWCALHDPAVLTTPECLPPGWQIAPPAAPGLAAAPSSASALPAVPLSRPAPGCEALPQAASGAAPAAGPLGVPAASTCGGAGAAGAPLNTSAPGASEPGTGLVSRGTLCGAAEAQCPLPHARAPPQAARHTTSVHSPRVVRDWP